MEYIYIKDEHIVLGQMLKLTNLFESGGFIKNYLKEEGVLVNGEMEHRRGRKLIHGDVIQIDDEQIYKVQIKE